MRNAWCICGYQSMSFIRKTFALYLSQDFTKKNWCKKQIDSKILRHMMKKPARISLYPQSSDFCSVFFLYCCEWISFSWIKYYIHVCKSFKKRKQKDFLVIRSWNHNWNDVTPLKAMFLTLFWHFIGFYTFWRKTRSNITKIIKIEVKKSE